MSQNNIELKNEETRAWLGDNGIVRIKLGEDWGGEKEEAMEYLIKEIIEIANNLTTKPKLLINLGLAPHHFYSSIYRKKMVKLARKALKELSYEKVAVYGGVGGRAQKIVVSFITAAAGVKNIKLFDTEEEALKWLKEE